MITAEQIRKARELLGWSQQRLRRNAGINTGWVREVESGTVTSETSVARYRVIVALEEAGIRFGNDGSVTLR